MNKNVAIIQNGFIVNVVVYPLEREFVDGEILEEDAISQGLTWEPPPPPEPEPDFDAMATALRTENGFKDAFRAAQDADPMATGSLTVAFHEFRTSGDYSYMLRYMLLVLSLLPPEQAAEIGTEFLAVAARCHMPIAFLQALQGAFDAE